MSRHRDDATFDLTPMIDVVLLLIIFFMMTTQFARSEQASMNLPEEQGEDAPQESPRTIFLDLSKEGAISLRGVPVPLEDAAATVQGAAAIGPDALDVRVVVRADKDCPAVHFSSLCAALTRAGIKTISLGTSPGDPSAAPGARR